MARLSKHKARASVSKPELDFEPTMRLQRYLARCGAASRRGAENLMTAGRVCVNGEVVRELGSKVVPNRDKVTVDGIEYKLAMSSSYVMLNKPKGYLTTMSDPRHRPCVAELVPIKTIPGLFPVGRLDQDTTGLLLFTTNGSLANELLHPSRHVWKHYIALVKGHVSKEERKALQEGIILDDGPTQPAEVALMSAHNPSAYAVAPHGVDASHSVVSIRIHEGRKHQVKRMLKAVGHEVVQLHRDEFGPLVLPRNLAPGAWRMLSSSEIASLEADTSAHTSASKDA